MRRKSHLTRAELLAGIVAAGALAACGRAVDPGAAPNVPKLCPSSAPGLVGVDQIFSDPVFKDLDKQKLVELFDPSPQIAALYQGYFAQNGRQPQSDTTIRSIPAAGISIKTPGTYTLAGDITWTPSANSACAIAIECSDVTLNLGGYTLTAAIPDKSWQSTGILAAAADGKSAISNITITNGTVANLTENGILASGVCGLNLSHLTVAGVCMQNITQLFTPSGIHVGSSLDVTIFDCSVTQLDVTADSCAGIFVLKSIGVAVTNCRTASLVNHDGAVQGFSCINCVKVTTNGCSAESLQSFFNGNTKTSGHTVLGFCPIFCWDISYVDCSASGLTGCCDDCHGMSVFLDGKVTVTGFRADNVVDGPAPYNTGAKATGLEVYGVDVTVTDSFAKNITANNPQDKQSTGFSAWGLGITFERCEASNIVARDDVGGGSLGTGFGWAPDPRALFCYFGAIDVTYTDCTADTCDVGFDTWYHIDSKWIRPVYTDCNTGILVQPDASRTLSCDGCSECPPGGPLTPPDHGSVTLKNIASGNTFQQ